MKNKEAIEKFNDAVKLATDFLNDTRGLQVPHEELLVMFHSLYQSRRLQDALERSTRTTEGGEMKKHLVAVLSPSFKNFKAWSSMMYQAENRIEYKHIYEKHQAFGCFFMDIIYLKGWYEMPNASELQETLLTRMERSNEK